MLIQFHKKIWIHSTGTWSCLRHFVLLQMQIWQKRWGSEALLLTKTTNWLITRSYLLLWAFSTCRLKPSQVTIFLQALQRTRQDMSRLSENSFTSGPPGTDTAADGFSGNSVLRIQALGATANEAMRIFFRGGFSSSPVLSLRVGLRFAGLWLAVILDERVFQLEKIAFNFENGRTCKLQIYTKFLRPFGFRYRSGKLVLAKSAKQ